MLNQAVPDVIGEIGNMLAHESEQLRRTIQVGESLMEASIVRCGRSNRPYAKKRSVLGSDFPVIGIEYLSTKYCGSIS